FLDICFVLSPCWTQTLFYLFNIIIIIFQHKYSFFYINIILLLLLLLLLFIIINVFVFFWAITRLVCESYTIL
ncbi:MAG: hypothetical protein N7Q72_03965, partial [Spiroplasma sp. Tabriz.8]|nr:hypothetical protein [Spiroplasma sp. Tabriz.8]